MIDEKQARELIEALENARNAVEELNPVKHVNNYALIKSMLESCGITLGKSTTVGDLLQSGVFIGPNDPIAYEINHCGGPCVSELCPGTGWINFYVYSTGKLSLDFYSYSPTESRKRSRVPVIKMTGTQDELKKIILEIKEHLEKELLEKALTRWPSASWPLSFLPEPVVRLWFSGLLHVNHFTLDNGFYQELTHAPNWLSVRDPQFFSCADHVT